MAEIRKNHYEFAHIRLRDFAVSDPDRFLTMMGSDDATDFLQYFWDMVSGDSEGSELCFSKEGELSVEYGLVGSYPYNLISLPSPVASCECYMVLFLVKNDIDEIDDETEYDLAYYTLEKGETTSGEDRTVLGGWDLNTGSHLNYGSGPVADKNQFLEAVSRIL